MRDESELPESGNYPRTYKKGGSFLFTMIERMLIAFSPFEHFKRYPASTTTLSKKTPCRYCRFPDPVIARCGMYSPSTFYNLHDMKIMLTVSIVRISRDLKAQGAKHLLKHTVIRPARSISRRSLEQWTLPTVHVKTPMLVASPQKL